MYRPYPNLYPAYNPIRQRILKIASDWKPKADWTKDPIKDAELLITECRRLIPYLLVVNNVVNARVRLYDGDHRYAQAMVEAASRLCDTIRTWILGSPYGQQKEKPERPTYDEHGNLRTDYKAAIKIGKLDKADRIQRVTLEINYYSLLDNYPHWLTQKRDAPYRVNELFSFCHMLARPEMKVSSKGSGKNIFAFIHSEKEQNG